MEIKTCNKCDTDKPISDFNKDKSKKDGYRSICKLCVKYYQKTRNERIRREKPIKEKITLSRKEYQSLYYKNNSKEIKNKSKKYYSNNIKKVKDYRLKNKDKKKIHDKKYRENNKEKRNIRERERRNNDKLYKLTTNIRKLICLSFSRGGFNKSSKTQDILGCTFKEFKQHIESQWEDWMNWDNYGKYNGELDYGWDIDHIICLSSAINEGEVIKLNHFTNLQPLCGYTNRYIKANN